MWTTAELLKGKKVIDKQRQGELANYLNEMDFSSGVGPKLKQLLMRGVGVHHAGVLPRYRKIVESLFQKKLLLLRLYGDSCCRNQSAAHSVFAI